VKIESKATTRATFVWPDLCSKYDAIKKSDSLNITKLGICKRCGDFGAAKYAHKKTTNTGRMIADRNFINLIFPT